MFSFACDPEPSQSNNDGGDTTPMMTSPDTPNNGAMMVEGTCEDITLEESSGEPLDSLLVTSERTLDDFQPQVRAPRGDWVLASLDRQEETVSLIVPPHPDGIMGGELELRWIDDLSTELCDGGEPAVSVLTVQPLEPAPGEFAKIVTATESLAEESASQMGWTLEELRAAPLDEVPVELWDLRHAALVIENDEVDGTLDQLAEREDLELVDAILAKAGLATALENELESLRALAPEQPPSFSRKPVTVDDAPFAAGLTDADIFRVDIETAADLSYFMRLVAHYESRLNSPELKTTEKAVALAGLFPPASPYAAAIGAEIFVLKQIAGAATALFPSSLEKGELKLQQEVFAEDDPIPYASILEYTTYGRSKPFKIGRFAADTLLEVFFTAKGFTKAGAGAQASKSRFDMVRDDLKSGPDGEVISALEGNALGEVDNRVKSEIGNLFGDLDEVYISPFLWGPIDITSSQWSTLEIDQRSPAPEAIEIAGANAREYFPWTAGVSGLVLQARPGAFPPDGNKFTSRIAKPVEVLEIVIDVKPDRQRIQPNDVVELTVEVRNSTDETDVEWKATAGELIVGPRNQSATLNVPSEIPDGGIKVTVTSLHDTGARSPERGPVERFDTSIFYEFEQVTIDPGFVCVDEPEPLMFTAIVSASPGNEDVTWEAPSGGAVTQDGVYTPPAMEGTYPVVAYLTGSPDVRDAAAVQVGGCSCYYEFEIIGVGAFSGPYVSIQELGPTLLNIRGDFYDNDGTMANFTLLTPKPGESGDSSIIIDVGNGTIYGTGDTTPPLVINLTEEDNGNAIRGTVEGTLFYSMDNSDMPNPYPLSLRFRGENINSGTICQ